MNYLYYLIDRMSRAMDKEMTSLESVYLRCLVAHYSKYIQGDGGYFVKYNRDLEEAHGLGILKDMTKL